MAFIPDKAIADSHELSPAAFRLYTFVCKSRNKDREGFWLPFRFVKRHLQQMPKATFYRARAQLLEKGWIEIGDADFVKPLRGFDCPTNETKSLKNETSSKSEIPVRSETDVLTGETAGLTGKTSSLKNGKAYIRNNHSYTSHSTSHLEPPSTEPSFEASVGTSADVPSLDEKRKICERCKGNGWIAPKVKNVKSLAISESEDCTACGGTGYQ